MKRKLLIILTAALILVPWLVFYHNYFLFGQIYAAPTSHALVPGAEGSVELSQFDQRDRGLVQYPEWKFLHSHQASGASPYWNPYHLSGMPLLPLSSFMDPLRFLLGLSGPLLAAETTYMLAMMIRSILALIFAFLIFRHFKIGYLWSATGAVAFWFNLPNLVLHHTTFDPLYLWAALIWLNLKLWSASNWRRQLLWGLGITLVYAAEIHSYHLHFGILIPPLLIVFNSVLALREYRHGVQPSKLLRAFSILAGTGVLAAVIGFFRIWVFLDFSSYSYRMVVAKPAGGLLPFIPFGVLYFPYLGPFQNALRLFTSTQLHPIHPDWAGLVGAFDSARIVFFPLFSRFGLIDALYRSPLWYLMLFFVFLEPKTRRQAFPFWASYLFILVGYNVVAVFNLILGDLLPPTLQAVNWLYLVGTATHSLLAFCFGFGLVGLWRLLRLHQRQQRQAGTLGIFPPGLRKPLLRMSLVAAAVAVLGGVILWTGDSVGTLAKGPLHSLVFVMYNKTAPAFLSRLISGQDKFPLEYYYARADRLWGPVFGVLGYIFIVVMPVVILSFSVLRFTRRFDDQQRRNFLLSTVLSIATIILAGYGVTYIFLGMQIHRNAAYVSEQLQLGLVASGLDAELSSNTSAYFQESLAQLYHPLPGICGLLLGTTVGGLGLLWYGLYRPGRRTVILLTLTLLLGLEGVFVTSDREDRTPSQYLSPQAAWIDFLRDRIGQYRYLAYSGSEWQPAIKTVSLSNGDVRQVYDLSLVGLAMKRYGIMKPDADLPYRLEHLEGLSQVLPNDYRVFTHAPTLMAGQDELTWSQLIRSTTEMEFPFYKSRAFDLLSMKYLATQADLNDPDYLLVYDDGKIKIYENTRVFPRAWLVSDYEVYAERYEVLRRLSSSDFDPHQTVLLEKQPVQADGFRTRYGLSLQIPTGDLGGQVVFTEMGAWQRRTLAEIPADALPFDTSPSDGGEAIIISYNPGHIRYQVKTASNQLLVLSEIFYPGWQARLDDRPVDIYRANYALMAVPVTRGEHQVELWFEPDSYAYAGWISLGALCLTVVIFVVISLWEFLRFKLKCG